MPDHHLRIRVAPEKVDEFAAAIGEQPNSHHGYAAPTYAMTLLGTTLFALLNDLDIDPEGDTVLHTSQRFDYNRQLRAGEIVDCRISMSDPSYQLAGESLKITCQFIAGDGTTILTSTTGLVIRRDPRRGQQ
jgi:hypothetical protein